MDILIKVKNLKNLTVDDLTKEYKMEYVAKFIDVYKNNLTSKNKKTKKQLCKTNDISDFTLKRFMKDLGMKSFYRQDNNKTNKIIIKSGLNDKESEKFHEKFEKIVDSMKNNPY
jgi:predicted kinase